MLLNIFIPRKYSVFLITLEINYKNNFLRYVKLFLFLKKYPYSILLQGYGVYSLILFSQEKRKKLNFHVF